MNKFAHGTTLAFAALCGIGALAHGALDASALASRYASFQKQQIKKWSLSKTTSGLTGALGLSGTTSLVTNTLDRALRYTVKLTSGTINPTNTAMFGSDLGGLSARLDNQIGLTASHSRATGRDVVVAVLDSGFNVNHPAIASRVLPYGFDPVSQDWDPQDRGNGQDDDRDGSPDLGVGHGTFVSGMVLAAAPDAWILPVRIADDEGYGMESELLAGIDFAVQMRANVINLSFEAGALPISVRDKLREADAAGIVVVVSAGNDAADSTKTMAQDATTLAVGAVNYEDAIAPFSNTPTDGRGLSLFAPGVSLYGPHGGPYDDANCVWSGTSFSAPLASGAVALVLEMNPGLTTSQVRDRVRAASTTPVRAKDGTTYPFAGRLDLRRVVMQ
jgi:subtilisin family serine protease